MFEKDMQQAVNELVIRKNINVTFVPKSLVDHQC